MIPYGRQHVSDADVEAVVEVLRSDFLTQGPVVPEFEAALAARCGAAHGVAANSGTSALHLACLALGIGAGERVWTSPITYVASANCARYCGAQVDFVDVDPATGNMCPGALERKLEEAAGAGELPRAVIPVHFAGQPCDMREIAELARRYGFRVIEDAAHALGATYAGEPVGGGAHADVTVFSFHPVKLITTGEGGMAMTNDAVLAERMRRLRSHGVERTPDGEGPWSYALVELGFNYRMTDLQAALGLSQLGRLDAFLHRREALARGYREKLAGVPVRTPLTTAGRTSAWHLYAVHVEPREGGPDRRAVYERMRAAGIGVNVHYIPVHTQPYYRDLYGGRIRCPAAEAFYASVLTLPLHPSLEDAQQDFVVRTLKAILA